MRLFSRTDNSDSSVRYATPGMNTEGLLEIENGNEACRVEARGGEEAAEKYAIEGRLWETEEFLDSDFAFIEVTDDQHESKIYRVEFNMSARAVRYLTQAESQVEGAGE